MLKKLGIPLLSLLTATALPIMSHAAEVTPSSAEVIPSPTEYSVKAVTQEEASIKTESDSSTYGGMTTSSISDPSGWQSRGQYGNYVYVGTNYTYIPSGSGVNWISGGGDFKVEFTGISSGNSFTAQLMEYDPDNADDPVGSPIRIDGFNNVLLAQNITGFTDGSDGDAEFYVKIYNAWTQDYVYGEGFD
jgi:hypothetical protein